MRPRTAAAQSAAATHTVCTASRLVSRRSCCAASASTAARAASAAVRAASLPDQAAWSRQRAAGSTAPALRSTTPYLDGEQGVYIYAFYSYVAIKSMCDEPASRIGTALSAAKCVRIKCSVR